MKIAFCISSTQSAGIELVMLVLKKRDHEITVFVNTDSPSFTEQLRDRFEVVLLEKLLFWNHESLIKLYAQLLHFDCVLYDHHSVVRTIAEQLPHRMEFNTTPRFFPTSAYPYATFSKLILPALNKLSYRLKKPAAHAKRKELILFRKHLPPHRIGSVSPSLYGMSTTLLHKPGDYPVNSYFSGLWVNKVPTISKGCRLLEKLSKKKILILISEKTPSSNAKFLQLCSEICKEINVQLIAISCDEDAGGFRYLVENDILFLDDSAHDLIPFVDAVIHAEDGETSRQCLYHGKPTLVYTSKFYDDLDDKFWANVSYKKHCSVSSVRMHTVTRKELTHKMELLIHQEQMHTDCSDISIQLKKEDGVQKAADLIELHFSASFHQMPQSMVTPVV